MAASLVTNILTSIAGGSAALALDVAKPDWGYTIPGTAMAPTPTSPGSLGIRITPGAMAAVAATVGLLMIPGDKGWQKVAMQVATGALVAEGTLLASTTVVPAFKGLLGVPTQPVGAPIMAGVYGVPRGLPYQQQVGVTDYELQQSLAQYRARAA